MVTDRNINSALDNCL